MGSLVVLSGPVGSGKTTFAQVLIAAPDRPTAYIEGDVFLSFVVKEHAGGRFETFRAGMRAMLAAAAAYARSDFDVVLDFSIPPAFMERSAKRLKNADLRYVVLLPSEAVCAARAASRSE